MSRGCNGVRRDASGVLEHSPFGCKGKRHGASRVRSPGHMTAKASAFFIESILFTVGVKTGAFRVKAWRLAALTR